MTATERMVRWLIVWRIPLLLLAGCGLALSWRPAQNMHFDRSIENMFAPGDPLIPSYRKLKRVFGGNEVVIAAYVDAELFAPVPAIEGTDASAETGGEPDENGAQPPGMARVRQLAEQIKAIPGVGSVFTVASTPLGGRIVNDNQVSRAFLSLLEGYAVGADRRTAAVVCVLEEAKGSYERAETLGRIRQLLSDQTDEWALAGEPAMVNEGFRSIDADGRMLGWLSTGLLSATILICFRSLRWWLAPLAVVYFTLIWTKALLVLGEFRLSMVSSMLWAVISVVAIATVVHLIVGFRDRRDRGESPAEALRIAGTALAAPIVWALLTDVAGFGSLLVSHVGPVKDFGFMMALGTLLCLVAVATLIPGLSLLGHERTPSRAPGEHRLEAALAVIVSSILARPRTVGLISLVIAVLAFLGSLQVEVETDFTRNFRSGSRIVRSYDLIERRLGGTGVWDVIVPAPQEWDENFVDRVRRLERRLREEVQVLEPNGQSRPGLTKVMSLVDVLDTAESLPIAPLLRWKTIDERIEMLGKGIPGLLQMLRGNDPHAPERHYARIMLRSLERQSSRQKEQLIAQVQSISRQEFPEAEVTGFFVLLARLIDSLIRDQWVSFGVAIGAIGLMLILAFRQLSLAVVALIPNILPMFLVTGLMGWLGLRLNMGAAMIAAVSVGLSVDSSVHYLTIYRRLRAEGQSLRETLLGSHDTAGRAMTFSTLALVMGFSALCFSQFVPTIYFGALMAVSMLGGLLGNLVVLPLLLFFTQRETGGAPSAP